MNRPTKTYNYNKEKENREHDKNKKKLAVRYYINSSNFKYIRMREIDFLMIWIESSGSWITIFLLLALGLDQCYRRCFKRRETGERDRDSLRLDDRLLVRLVDRDNDRLPLFRLRLLVAPLLRFERDRDDDDDAERDRRERLRDLGLLELRRFRDRFMLLLLRERERDLERPRGERLRVRLLDRLRLRLRLRRRLLRRFL